MEREGVLCFCEISKTRFIACCEREKLVTRKWERHINPTIPSEFTTRKYVCWVPWFSQFTCSSTLMSLKCSSIKVTNDVEGGFYFWLCVILHRQVPCSVRADCWHHFASSLVVCLFVAISFNCNLALLQ